MIVPTRVVNNTYKFIYCRLHTKFWKKNSQHVLGTRIGTHFLTWLWVNLTVMVAWISHFSYEYSLFVYCSRPIPYSLNCWIIYYRLSNANNYIDQIKVGLLLCLFWFEVISHEDSSLDRYPMSTSFPYNFWNAKGSQQQLFDDVTCQIKQLILPSVAKSGDILCTSFMTFLAFSFLFKYASSKKVSQ